MRALVLICCAVGIACDESGSSSGVDATTSATTDADTGGAADVTDVVASPDPRCLVALEGCLERQRTCVVVDDEASCVACPAGQYPARPDGACTAIPGTALSYDFGTQSLTPGQEIGSLCQTWVLDNDEALWVNAVEMDNDGFYHHSNWFHVPEGYKDWPTGPWLDCYDEGFHEIDAALAGGVVYAQSTQVKRELQKFVPGAAVRIPPRSRIITVTHLLNYTPAPQTTGLRLTIHTLPRDAVTIPLTPAQVIYSDLAIPPESESYFGSTCDLRSAYTTVIGDEPPFSMKLHYVLPHYHALGAGFEVIIVGGSRDGEVIVDLGAYRDEPFGFAFDPPIDLGDATGLRWGCKFDNPTADVVRWGIGDQEMCEGLFFLESAIAFSAQTTETATESEVGGVKTFSGACNVLAFPFDPDGK
ncbi:MAG: hypothetical protein IT385_27745 [Deltaproteobacteria bacterium]|nr:hypothetical protein [Deltaproteobacteria bacterium]